MDCAPRMPNQHRNRRMVPLGRSATNEVPKPRSTQREREERLTPPLEIFVRELTSLSAHTASESGGCSNSNFDNSAMTDITFDASFCHNSTINNNNSMIHLEQGANCCNASVTSDVSSVVDHNHNAAAAHYHPTTSGSGSGDQCRLPPRRQSSRRADSNDPNNRSIRKGVMRWASMPMSSLHQSSRHSSTDDVAAAPLIDVEDSPKLPKRRGSNPSILSSGSDNDDDDEEEQEEQQRLRGSQKQNTSNSNSSGSGSGGSGSRNSNKSNREKPRLPIRKKSSESLFSNVQAKSSSECETTEEIIVRLGAHAA